MKANTDIQELQLFPPSLPTTVVTDDGHPLGCLEKARPMAAWATRRDAFGIKLAMQVDGYAFPWGSIAERQEPGRVVCEFYLEQAINQFESGGNSLYQLQLLLFESLEARVDCVSRSFVVGCAGPVGLGAAAWVIVPGGLASGIVFSLVCKYPDSQACREWLCTEFIPCILPESIGEASGRALPVGHD